MDDLSCYIIIHSCVNSFRKIFTEHMLCARDRARSQEDGDSNNRAYVPGNSQHSWIEINEQSQWAFVRFKAEERMPWHSYGHN